MPDNELSPLPDPGGIQAAVDRYRDLARYLVTILAAVGATLVAGTQLSSIGELSWSHDPYRVVATVSGFVLAITAVVWIVSRALDVLRPIEMSLQDIAADAELETDVKRLGMLGGVESVAQLQAMLRAPGQSPPQRNSWQKTGEAVIGRASYVVARGRFERAWRGMQLGGVAAIFGIVAFAWGANPPPAEDAPDPEPVPVVITLTPMGKEVIRETVGPTCAETPVRGLAIGGDLPNPEVVTTPSRGCPSIRAEISSDLGQALRVRP